MIPYVIITVIGIGAGLLITGKDEPPAPPPAPAAEASFQPLADAVVWAGKCSVACSMIWGGCIVYTARLKRKDRP